jgi:hypothetical protein
LSACWDIIEKTKVRLRGWDYPHLSRRREELETGQDYVASCSDFMGHLEYWRFYQSGQFLHLFSVREQSEPEFRQHLEALTRSHLGWGDMKDFDWSNVPGFISITNFLYTVTEVFEFAARLCTKGIFEKKAILRIELQKVKGFVLTTEWNRAWYNYYAADQDQIARRWELPADILVSQSAEQSLAAVIWFFERFGWRDPSIEVLRQDQENFLKGRI